MSTSVKMSEETKKRLNRLQAKVILSTGRKPSQEQLLDAVVRLSSEREEELMRHLAGVNLPFSSREVEDLMKVITDWGAVTREEDIDKVLSAGLQERDEHLP